MSDPLGGQVEQVMPVYSAAFKARVVKRLVGPQAVSAAVRAVFGERVPIQWCQGHKCEKVVSYLPQTWQALWRRKL